MKRLHQLQTQRICCHLVAEGGTGLLRATGGDNDVVIFWSSGSTCSNKKTQPRSAELGAGPAEVSNMSGRYFDIRRDSGYGGNCIPSGRQLPRTPPLTDVKRHLDFSRDDSNMEVRVDLVRSLLQFIKPHFV